MRGSAGTVSIAVLLLVFISAASRAGGVEAIAGSNVENPQVIHATPVVLVGSVPSKDVLRCARVNVSGLSRLRLGSYSSAHRINLVPSDDIHERSHKRIRICLHRNSSLGLCQCKDDDWDTIRSGMWSSVISPYEDRYIDVKFVDNLSGSVTVSIELEFHKWRLMCLGIGFVLLLLSPIVSSWVPFYYSSSMAIGVCLVIIIVLFQARKLLPFGGKSALYSIVCSLAQLGVGSFLLNRLSGFVNSVLVDFGVTQEMHNPVLVFLLVGIGLAGAGFGYWLVRKFVVADDGTVDVGVAQFVKWALRSVAVFFIFESTFDYPMALLGLLVSLLGSCLCLTPLNWHGFRDLIYSADWSPKKNSRKVSKTKCVEFRRRSGNTTPRRSLWKSSKSSPTFSNSPIKGVVTPNSEEYYSTFHQTPNRKRFTEEEWKDFSEQSTRQAVADLTSTPEFTDWIISHADRIQLRAESSTDESTGSGSDSTEENLAKSSRGSLWPLPW